MQRARSRRRENLAKEESVEFGQHEPLGAAGRAGKNVDVVRPKPSFAQQRQCLGTSAEGA